MHYAGDSMIAERDAIEVLRKIDGEGWLARRGRQTSLLMESTKEEIRLIPPAV
jgi:hypothetical protein